MSAWYIKFEKMNATESIKPTYTPGKGSAAISILNILTLYPLIWTAGILIYALVKIKAFIIFIMLTWVIFICLGSLSWIGLLIFLTVKKKITIKQTVLHVLIFTIGSLVAYYVLENDVLNSGIKYMD
jgi:hypothetical protein